MFPSGVSSWGSFQHPNQGLDITTTDLQQFETKVVTCSLIHKCIETSLPSPEEDDNIQTVNWCPQIYSYLVLASHRGQFQSGIEYQFIKTRAVYWSDRNYSIYLLMGFFASWEVILYVPKEDPLDCQDSINWPAVFYLFNPYKTKMQKQLELALPRWWKGLQTFGLCEQIRYKLLKCFSLSLFSTYPGERNKISWNHWFHELFSHSVLVFQVHCEY